MPHQTLIEAVVFLAQLDSLLKWNGNLKQEGNSAWVLLGEILFCQLEPFLLILNWKFVIADMP